MIPHGWMKDFLIYLMLASTTQLSIILGMQTHLANPCSNTQAHWRVLKRLIKLVHYQSQLVSLSFK